MKTAAQKSGMYVAGEKIMKKEKIEGEIANTHQFQNWWPSENGMRRQKL